MAQAQCARGLLVNLIAHVQEGIFATPAFWGLPFLRVLQDQEMLAASSVACVAGVRKCSAELLFLVRASLLHNPCTASAHGAQEGALQLAVSSDLRTHSSL